MKTKVLILGSTGMLGHQVYYHFSDFPEYEVKDIVFRNKLTPNSIIVDVSRQMDVEKALLEIQPKFVINCVGVLISGSNENPENAIYINSYLPHQLSRLCRKINAKLIHISTDCVFSGDRGSYIETDYKDGKDIYAKTKSLGEVINNIDLTIRTSIIGPELKKNGEGLLHWFMMQSGEINGFSKSIWSGVTTLELAKVIRLAINKGIKGLYHVTNNDSIDKYSLLCRLKEILNRENITIRRIEGKSVNKSFIDTRKELGYDVFSYPEMLVEMKSFIDKHKDLYLHYF